MSDSLARSSEDLTVHRAVQSLSAALNEPSRVGRYASKISHHPNGSVAGFTYGNGIVHSLLQNARGLPEQARDAGVLNDAYSYDQNGNVTGIVDQQDGTATRTMEYDEVDRLAKVTAANLWGTASYSYDALDNLTSSALTGGPNARSTTHSFDSTTNRLSGISSTASAYNLGYGYDLRGNITQRGAQSYVFDLANRLSSAPGKANYSYDGHGRRVKIVQSDGTNRVQIYDQAGQLRYAVQTGGPNPAVTTKYIYLNRHVLAEVAGANVQYDHTDALGSPVARTNAAGAIVSRTRYEPYGMTAAGTNPDGIGFTGHVNDTNTGLVQMQQRYYDPVAGRFLSMDPVLTDVNSGGSFNRYNYANNSPYKYIDPDGRAVESVTVDSRKNVHIVIGISYKGSVTPQEAKANNDAIIAHFGGKKGEYAVTMTIVPAENAKLGNFITVKDGSGISTTSGIGAREATVFKSDHSGASTPNTVAHETGHLMGLSNQVYRGGTPKEGYEGSIMADPRNGTGTERDIADIIKANPARNE